MEVVTTTVTNPGTLNFPTEALPDPKFVKSNLDMVPGMFIQQTKKPKVISGVPTNEFDVFWNYYPMKVSSERKGNFYDIEVLPVVLGEGFTFVNNTLLHVPINDLARRHINATRIITQPTRETNSAVEAPSPERLCFESSASPDIGPEISQAIDLAIQEQIESLQYLENSEKGLF